jgi:type IV pilus assembly protein PilV
VIAPHESDCGASSRRRDQRGFVLLDAMIAILIFSVGILGMVALQGAATKLAGDAQYRSNAAMFADQVIAQMWGDYNSSGNGALLATDYSTNGAKYKTWASAMDCSQSTLLNCLPGVTANKPTIVVKNTVIYSPDDSTTLVPSSLVTVTVSWQAPNDAGPHSYVTTTNLSP